MLKYWRWILPTIALAIVACGGSNPLPTTNEVPQEAPKPVAVGTPTVISPSTPADPANEYSYIIWNERGGGEFCALPKGGSIAYLTYTVPGDVIPVYGMLSVQGTLNKCVPFPDAADVVTKCGKYPVQIDANQDGPQAGRHIGHKVLSEVFKECPVPVPTPTPSPKPSPTPEPKCEPKWIEQPPSYGEWGECKKQPEISQSCGSSCHQYRTITIFEKNSCTNEMREKSQRSESRDCNCPPEPQAQGICHVSNKGRDNDINLVVTYKSSGLGHEKHADMTDKKYCPHDRVAPMFSATSKPKSFACKLEGKDAEKFCKCEPFIEEAKSCSTIWTEDDKD